MQVRGRCSSAWTAQSWLLKMCHFFQSLAWKKCIFLFLETIEVPTTMKSYVHRDAPNLVVHDIVPRCTPASGWDRLEVHFSVKMLSTAYFSTSTMKCCQSRLHSHLCHWFGFFLLQWSFSATHLNSSWWQWFIYQLNVSMFPRVKARRKFVILLLRANTIY